MGAGTACVDLTEGDEEDEEPIDLTPRRRLPPPRLPRQQASTVTLVEDDDDGGPQPHLRFHSREL